MTGLGMQVVNLTLQTRSCNVVSFLDKHDKLEPKAISARVFSFRITG